MESNYNISLFQMSGSSAYIACIVQKILTYAMGSNLKGKRDCTSKQKSRTVSQASTGLGVWTYPTQDKHATTEPLVPINYMYIIQE
jgi:hypothetical protein